MHVKKKTYQKIYEIIIKEGRIPLNDFSPNIIINQGKYEFFDIEAESLIYHCADAIDLSPDYLEKYFPYDTYFEEEKKSILDIFIPLLLIYWILIIIYEYLKRGIQLLLKIPINEAKKEEPIINTKPSLTASQFADIMFDLLKNYQKNKKKQKI